MKQNHFHAFSFQPHILKAIEELQFYQPTDIQQQVIPSVLNGKSVIGESNTGSGKTHAFLLPLFNQLQDKQEVQFVVTAPTRELAKQIYEEAKRIATYAGKNSDWKIKLLTGGTDKQRMMDGLKESPHVVIGTPGRILDMVKSGVLSLYTAHAFVVDEADLMLDMGFLPEIDQLLVRSQQDIQLLAFSATIPRKLAHFFDKYMRNPSHVKLDDGMTPEHMENRLINLKHRERSDVILALSRLINPYLAIIFTNGKDAADELAVSLQEKGLKVGLIHGGLQPRERKRVLKDIQNLRYQYVVATDLAARGIDIPGVSHVINAQLPKEPDFYVHRVGRTARAGLEGTAVSLYEDQDITLIRKLEEKGLTFTFYSIKNDEWQEVKAWNERSERQNKTNYVDKQAWKQVRKPKKVKPGYKKKMKTQKEQIKRQMNRKSNHKR